MPAFQFVLEDKLATNCGNSSTVLDARSSIYRSILFLRYLFAHFEKKTDFVSLGVENNLIPSAERNVLNIKWQTAFPDLPFFDRLLLVIVFENILRVSFESFRFIALASIVL